MSFKLKGEKGKIYFCNVLYLPTYLSFPVILQIPVNIFFLALRTSFSVIPNKSRLHQRKSFLHAHWWRMVLRSVEPSVHTFFAFRTLKTSLRCVLVSVVPGEYSATSHVAGALYTTRAFPCCFQGFLLVFQLLDTCSWCGAPQASCLRLTERPGLAGCFGVVISSNSAFCSRTSPLRLPYMCVAHGVAPCRSWGSSLFLNVVFLPIVQTG